MYVESYRQLKLPIIQKQMVYAKDTGEVQWDPLSACIVLMIYKGHWRDWNLLSFLSQMICLERFSTWEIASNILSHPNNIVTYLTIYLFIVCYVSLHINLTFSARVEQPFQCIL